MPRKNRYEQRLEEIINSLFFCATHAGLTLQEWADKAGLCYGTLWHINNGTTQRPQLRTILLMAWAIGIDLELTGVPKAARRTARTV